MEKRALSLAALLAIVGFVFLALGAVALANGLPPGGTFTDDDGNVHEGNIEAIAAKGITRGCNPAEGNTRYCPASRVSRGQMAAFLSRALNLPATATDFFVDDDDSIFENDINRMAQAGITKGCNPSQGNTRFCPDSNVTRGVMAAFLVRAFGYTDNGGGDIFEDDDNSIFESDIDKLATAGVTKGCNPSEGNTRYCPQSLVSRAQMASFLARALKLSPIVPPSGPLVVDDFGRFLGGDIVMGSDGRPIIAYQDDARNELGVARCSTPSCLAVTRQRLDSGTSGGFQSVAIRKNHLPIVSYLDRPSMSLRIARCSDADCSAASFLSIGGSLDVGTDTAIVIGSDGYPIISHHNASQVRLRAAHCKDANCLSVVDSDVDLTGETGWYTSIAIGRDGLPIIAYFDLGNTALKVAHCEDLACDSATISTLVSAGVVGSDTSIAIRHNGLPVIAYEDSSNHDVELYWCANPACTSGGSTALDSAGDVGGGTDIAIDEDGLIVVSYIDRSDWSPRIATCMDIDCIEVSFESISADGPFAAFTSLTLAADRSRLIVYADDDGRTLKVARIPPPRQPVLDLTLTTATCTSSSVSIDFKVVNTSSNSLTLDQVAVFPNGSWGHSFWTPDDWWPLPTLNSGQMAEHHASFDPGVAWDEGNVELLVSSTAGQSIVAVPCT